MRSFLKTASFLVAAMLAFGCDQPSIEFDTELNDPDNPIVAMETSMGVIHLELFEKDAPETVANFIGLAEGTKEFTDPNNGEKVKRPYYDGLIFHRVIQGFMMQGGCPLGSGRGDPGFKFKDEINAEALGLANQTVNSQEVQRFVFQKLQIRNQEEFLARNAEIDSVMKQYVSMSALDFFTEMGYKYDSSLNSHKAVRGVIAMANAGPNTNGSQFFITHANTPFLDGKHTVFGKVVKGMTVVDQICNVKTSTFNDKPEEDVAIISVRQVQ